MGVGEGTPGHKEVVGEGEARGGGQGHMGTLGEPGLPHYSNLRKRYRGNSEDGEESEPCRKRVCER